MGRIKKHGEISGLALSPGYPVWDHVVEQLSHVVFRGGDSDISFTVDWGPLVKDMGWFKDKTVFVHDLSGQKPEVELNPKHFLHGAPPLRCTIEYAPDEIDSPMHLLVAVATQLYFILNLSSPGCVLFDGFCRLEDQKKDILLNAFGSSEEPWPVLKDIPLQYSLKWLMAHAFYGKVMATTKVDRVLFSLLNLGAADRVSPTDLVWLSNALEALYDSPKSSIGGVLFQRVCLLLDVPTNQRGLLKKRLNEFYRLRSKFVHGEWDIWNPILLNNELVEVGLARKITRQFRENVRFASNILMASLQKLVSNGWADITFNETFQEYPILNSPYNGGKLLN